MQTTAEETEGAPAARGLEDRLHLAARVVQGALFWLVVLVLIALSILTLWDTFTMVSDQLRANHLTLAVTVGVDTVFLTIILLELMHTVVARGPLGQQIQEFLFIGITSGIRRGLSLVAAAGTPSASGTSGRDAVINLAINSGSVLLLVVGLWIVRHAYRGENEEHGKHESMRRTT